MPTIIEVRPDHGGKDAEDFAAELTASIRKYLTRSGKDAEVKPATEASKSFFIHTRGKTRDVRWLEGVHTVTRIPKGSSARHTSSATVVVIDPEAAHGVRWEVRDEDLRVDRYRGRGSGGQRKNKVSTAVRLVHKPTGIVITRETGRSQIDNLESAKEQLQVELDNRAREQRREKIDAQRDVLADKTRSFTHNYQRGEVVDHSTGKRWSMKQWNSGKIAK